METHSALLSAAAAASSSSVADDLVKVFNIPNHVTTPGSHLSRYSCRVFFLSPPSLDGVKSQVLFQLNRHPLHPVQCTAASTCIQRRRRARDSDRRGLPIVMSLHKSNCGPSRMHLFIHSSFINRRHPPQSSLLYELHLLSSGSPQKPSPGACSSSSRGSGSLKLLRKVVCLSVCKHSEAHSVVSK